MRLFDTAKHWRGLVTVLLGLAAVLGDANSVIQLSRFCEVVSGRFSTADWAQILLWMVLLIVWAVVFGLVVGFFTARQWYGVGVDQGSMAPSD